MGRMPSTNQFPFDQVADQKSDYNFAFAEFDAMLTNS